MNNVVVQLLTLEFLILILSQQPVTPHSVSLTCDLITGHFQDIANSNIARHVGWQTRTSIAKYRPPESGYAEAFCRIYEV